MATTLPLKPAAARGASLSVGGASAVSAYRLAFLADAPEAVRPKCEFTQPRRAVAVEEAVPLESVTVEGVESARADRCFVVFVPKPTPGDWNKIAGALLSPPGLSGGIGPFRVERGAEAIDWRPGLAVVQCRAESRSDVMTAVAEFAFYEGELRILEKVVEDGHTHAVVDASLGHRIAHRDRKQWGRLRDCAERFTLARLTFARLEPHLAAGARALSPPARRWIYRLLRRADVETRLEALNDRLEALEDLYEGANQRISEYRWYREGHGLEVGIIFILLVECMLMGADIYVHNRDRTQIPTIETPARP